MTNHNHNDEMELGNSGWIPFKDGYKNIHNGHTMDFLGREFDENGVMIYDPTEDEQNDTD